MKDNIPKDIDSVSPSLVNENPDHRNAFLIEWYKILWNNARQSMESIWKLIYPITLVGTVWVAIHQSYLPPILGNSLVFVILFWAINVTIDSNQWHRRNLIFYTAVERYFLKENDYGRLIYSKFKSPKTGWISFYRICLYAFITLLLLAMIHAVTPFCQELKICAPEELSSKITSRICITSGYDIWILILGIIYSFWNYVDQEKSTKKYKNELFGEKAKG